MQLQECQFDDKFSENCQDFDYMIQAPRHETEMVSFEQYNLFLENGEEKTDVDLTST